MADSTLPDAYVQKFLKSFALANINAEVDTITSGRFGVRSYPTTLLLNVKGQEIDRLVGYYPPEEFVGGITNALAGIGTLEDLLQRAETNPSVEANYEIGQKYRYRGDYGQATYYFMKVMAEDPANEKGKTVESAYNLAHMKYKLTDYTGAVALWRQMAADYPDDPMSVDGELMIAYSYQKAGDFKSAKKEYNAFLKKHPDTEEKEWIAEQFTAMDKKK
ncbi:MAG: tetratricopeptide repeat protein [Candidatus Zixiibacteriota bacterium]